MKRIPSKARAPRPMETIARDFPETSTQNSGLAPSASTAPRTISESRRGAILPLFTVLLPVLLILGAFAVNVAWMSLIRTEMQVATDAATRAAGREFSVTQSVAAGRQKAIDTVGENTVGGRVLTLSVPDIAFGESIVGASGAYEFTSKDVDAPGVVLGLGPGKTFVNAVQVDLTANYAMNTMPFPLPGLSLSGGYTPQATAVSTQTDRDIVLVLDRSGSMNEYSNDPDRWEPAGPGEAFYGSRWRELVDAVDVFLTVLEDSPLSEQVGLATFSHWTAADRALTTDFSPIRTSMDGYTNNFPGGRTAVGEGIYVGTALLVDPALARAFATRTLIVMTDGIQNTGRDNVVAAEAAAALGITVHTITFSAGARQDDMIDVATAGGGNHYHAESAVQLRDIFEELARNLPTMLTR